MLLLQALKDNGMTQDDVTLVNTTTNETPQTLASGKVAAIGAWYPVSGQALKQVPGSKPLFTSAQAKGLIYDVIAVSPTSYAKNKDAWSKITAIYYKCVDYLMDPATRDDADQDHGGKGRGRSGGICQGRARDAFPEAGGSEEGDDKGARAGTRSMVRWWSAISSTSTTRSIPIRRRRKAMSRRISSIT